MVRVGLGPNWTCVFANDNSSQKAAAYSARWGKGELDERSVDEIDPSDLPAGAQLAWASFPCQDLSVAGSGRGIGSSDDRATRSSALWPFIELMADLKLEGRQPSLIVLENVTGLLTSNGGADFRAICRALDRLEYDFGAVIIDTKHFLAQSRPRVFIVASRDDLRLPDGLTCEAAAQPWHSAGVVKAHSELDPGHARRWRWWNLGKVPVLADDALEHALDLGPNAGWHSEAETARLLSMMPATHIGRLAKAKRAGKVVIGSLYLRMRPEKGINVQRAEITFAPTLGCLRTPRGGGSRPRIIVVHGERVRTRLLSAREAAGLMGLPSTHPLPEKYEHAFRLIGDGVAAPVVRFLADRLIEPIACSSGSTDGIERSERVKEMA